MVLLNKPRSYIELINDKDPKIAALAYSYLLCPEELSKAVEYDLHSQGLLQFLANTNDLQQEMLARGLQKLYVQYHSFGAKGDTFGYTLNKPERKPNPYFSSIKITREGVRAIQNRLTSVKIFSEDYRVFLKRFSKIRKGFIYADPPYTMSREEKYYDYNFTRKDHLNLYETLDRFDPKRVKWLLSYDKSPLIERIYSKYFIHEVDIAYSLNVSTKAERVKKEYLISNYDISEQITKEQEIIPLDAFLETGCAEGTV